MGVFRLNPEGIDPDDLELYLIDHGLEEMGESTGEKGEPQLVARSAFEDFGQMQKALEDRGITPVSAEQEYVCLAPTELPRPRPTKSSSSSTSSNRTRTSRRSTTRSREHSAPPRSMPSPSPRW